MASSSGVTVDINIFICNQYKTNSKGYSCLRLRDSLEGQIRVSSPSALHFTDLENPF
jgi:hypothetical protein